MATSAMIAPKRCAATLTLPSLANWCGADMGYSTCGMHANPNRGPRTCDGCDSCPKCDGFTLRLVKCPVNYCGTDRLCPKCLPKYGKRDHSSCRKASAEMKARDARRAQLISCGLFVRYSATMCGEMVKVTFTNDVTDKEMLMSKETYHAIPLLEPATISDYQGYGPVVAYS